MLLDCLGVRRVAAPGVALVVAGVSSAAPVSGSAATGSLMVVVDA